MRGCWLPRGLWPSFRPPRLASPKRVLPAPALWRGATQDLAFRPHPLQVFAYRHPGKYFHSSVSSQRQNDRQQEAERFEFSTLNTGQLAELYLGRYPTNYEEDFIHLRGISTRGIKKIWKAFKRNESTNYRCKMFMKHDATFNTLIIFRSPKMVLEVMIDGIRNSFYSCPSFRENERFDFSSNVLSEEFGDALTAPPKMPDLLLQYSDLSRGIPPQTNFIAKVGFWESYDDLRRSMVQWLKGNPNVKLAFLVKISENPRYQSPKQLPEETILMRELAIGDFKQKIFDIAEDRHGQLFVHGNKYVGAFSMSLEVWVRDSEGEVVRKGEPIEFYNSKEPEKAKPENLVIKFSDFCPKEEVGDASFTVNWEKIRVKMAPAQWMLTFQRCRRALDRYDKVT